jgi:hypothetical protein
MCGFTSLRAAALSAAKGSRAAPTAARFLAELEQEILKLQRELLDGSYAPGPLTVFSIADPKPRRISAAPFRDRVVHHALCAALDPMFERFAIEGSFACRKGKGTAAAVRAVRRHARRQPWFAKVDVRRFFETVDHEVLLDRLSRRVADARALDLARRFLAAGGSGLPIGNLTSQHFGNFLLGHVDHFALERLRVPGWVRYMDDMIAFVPDREAGWDVVSEIDRFVRVELRQSLKHEVTRVAPTATGVPFLGYRIWPAQVRLDPCSLRRLRARLRAARDEPASARRSVCASYAWAGAASTRALLRADGAGRVGRRR